MGRGGSGVSGEDRGRWFSGRLLVRKACFEGFQLGGIFLSKPIVKPCLDDQKERRYRHENFEIGADLLPSRLPLALS